MARHAVKIRNLALPKHARTKDPRLAQDYDANRDALRFRAYLPGRRPFT